MTSPTMLPNFPYDGIKLTVEQRDDLAARIERLRFAMTDMVGLSGHHMALDEGSIANIAGHLALAGCDVDDEKAFIWGRRRTDDNVMFRDQVEWLLKQKQPPPEPDTDNDAASEAREIKAQIDRTMSAATRVELARIFRDDFNAATQDGE